MPRLLRVRCDEIGFGSKVGNEGLFCFGQEPGGNVTRCERYSQQDQSYGNVHGRLGGGFGKPPVTYESCCSFSTAISSKTSTLSFAFPSNVEADRRISRASSTAWSAVFCFGLRIV